MRFLHLKYSLIIFDLFPGELREVCVDGSLHKSRFDILSAINCVIDLISPVQNRRQLIICRHLGVVDMFLLYVFTDHCSIKGVSRELLHSGVNKKPQNSLMCAGASKINIFKFITPTDTRQARSKVKLWNDGF